MGSQSRLKGTDAFYRQKGADHAVDHCCYSLNFVAAGIGQWLHDWRIRSHPAGHRHHRGTDPSYSGAKTIVAIWTLAGEVFGKEVVSRSRKILPSLLISSMEKEGGRSDEELSFSEDLSLGADWNSIIFNRMLFSY